MPEIFFETIVQQIASASSCAEVWEDIKASKDKRGKG
jgi:hypothetical protein